MADDFAIEPMDDEDEFIDDFDDEDEYDCHGFFEGKHFMCMAAGSEDCDFECPYRNWLGLTRKQIDRMDG